MWVPAEPRFPAGHAAPAVPGHECPQGRRRTWFRGARLALERDRVPQRADAGDGDLDDVTLAEVARRDARVADAARRAGGDDGARLEGDPGGAVDDQVDDREDQVRGVRVLHRLARDDGADADRLEIHVRGARDARAHRREGVEALAERELAKRRLELRPAAGDIVQAGDAADRASRFLGGGAVDGAAEDDPHLALVVGPGLLAG